MKFLYILLFIPHIIFAQDTLLLGSQAIKFYPLNDFIDAMKDIEFKKIIERNTAALNHVIAYYLPSSEVNNFKLHDHFEMNNAIQIFVPNSLWNKSAKNINVNNFQKTMMSAVTGLAGTDFVEKENEVLNRLSQDEYMKDYLGGNKVGMDKIKLDLVFDTILNYNAAFFMTINKIGAVVNDSVINYTTIMCYITRIIKDKLIVIYYSRELPGNLLNVKRTKIEASKIAQSFY